MGPDGTIQTYLGGSDAVAFTTPIGLVLDAAGNLYVAERLPAIRKFTPTGRLFQIAGTGMSGYDGEGRPASTSRLVAPADLAFDSLGNLLIADGLRVRRVQASTGILNTVAGDAYTKAIGDRGPARQAQLSIPKGIAMDTGGNLYIADSGTHRIRRVGTDGTITTVAGTGTLGSLGDGRAPLDADLNAPGGVSLDGAGNLLVADSGNNRIRQVAGGVIRTVAGNGGTGLGAEGISALLMPLHGPLAAVADPRGNVFVADTLSHRILTMNPAAVIATAAGNASLGYSGDGGRAAQAQLREPSALALDAAGNIYIADALNHCIRKVSAGGVISTVAGSGTPGFGGDGGLAVEARLSAPRGVAVDGDGNLYIADTGNHAVRKVTGDGVIRTIAGTGTAGLGGDGALATEAMLNSPFGLLLDGSGNVYVADSLNNRVRRLSPVLDPHALELTGEARVVNGASLAQGAVAPGETVSIFGDGIGPDMGQSGSVDGSSLLPTEVAETQVLFDGTPAALTYVQAGQINAQVPYTVAGRVAVLVECFYSKELRARANLQVVPAAPALFTVSGGTGQVMAVQEDGSFNAEANPAPRGSIVTLFATGEGQTEPPGADGAPARAPYPQPVLPVNLTIGGIDAEILYAGAAPGLVGIMQINARVPAGFVPTGVLPVELTVGLARSQPGVTLAVN